MTSLNIGTRIRQHRQALDMSQEDLAVSCLCSRQTISNWETGKTLPDVQSLTYLATAFDTTVDDLLADDRLEIIRRSSADRRELQLLWAGVAFLTVLILPLDIVLKRDIAPTPDIPAALVYLVLLTGLIAIVARMAHIHQKHHLQTSSEIARYLSGEIMQGHGRKDRLRSRFGEGTRFALEITGWAIAFIVVRAAFHFFNALLLGH